MHLNGPKNFGGRKVGALISDDVDAELLDALRKALAKEGAMLELIAPMVGGVKDSAGTWIEAQQKIDGGPSVLYDAVAILLSAQGAQMLLGESTARDFVADAFAHCKFIAYVDTALPLIAKAVGEDAIDAGFVELTAARDAAKFVEACRKIRFWDRESKVKLSPNGMVRPSKSAAARPSRNQDTRP
jgi:catalase